MLFFKEPLRGKNIIFFFVDMSYWPSIKKRQLDVGNCYILFLHVYRPRQSQGQLTFSSGKQQMVQSKQDSTILPAWVANHNAVFGSFCLLTVLATEIITITIYHTSEQYFLHVLIGQLRGHEKQMAFVGIFILSQIKFLFEPLVIQLVW